MKGTDYMNDDSNLRREPRPVREAEGTWIRAPLRWLTWALRIEFIKIYLFI